ncbi:hypothetical protein DB42_AJ00200 [Neochlamydia sp. EPS4]|uniref:small ribosomal subunit Rsm22 family protein n=1 Tax=Neochlamydia sp. EPS4 TaxID=1478175 RepID=UPI000582F2EE|nr:small ribosomal subunit Rsm22 family protein [Neochlamydia sp. EPS4]KIC75332.1 hypothetical protein DB42_AJ00200 [Neochlamydia sp. EPS4]
MNLPNILQQALEREAHTLRGSALQQATQELSERYRNEKQRQKIMQSKQRFVSSPEQRIAYLLSRMPATFETIKYVLNKLKERYEGIFGSVLDVGAGPGTAMWAVSELFPHTCKITLLEQDNFLISLGKKLTLQAKTSLFREAQWVEGDVLKRDCFPESDLIVVSYAMGEWPQPVWGEIIKKLWRSARQALVIIEPGTMLGFQVVRQIRQHLIDLQAHILAPCPHQHACPMAEKDWCHFSVRLERSPFHKQAKGALLGYEDEKFSYIICTKTATALPEARILRHPHKHSGHLSFKLCTQNEGLADRIISRRHGELYKKARNLEWGDSL